MELNKIYIGVLFGILAFAGVFSLLADGIDKYSVSVPADYNDSYAKIRAELDDINATTGKMKDQLETIKTSSGVIDYLGFFFNSGYQALKTSGEITGSLFTFVDIGLESISPSDGGFLKIIFYSSIIVLLFIGIIMHAIIKSDRL